LISQEKAAIAAKADAHYLSASSCLRRLGLALPVESTIDQRAILDLVKINADLGRFGGLIKMWLTTNADFESLSAQGSGKGVGLILLTLLSWKESVFVTDLKGESCTSSPPAGVTSMAITKFCDSRPARHPVPAVLIRWVNCGLGTTLTGFVITFYS